MKKRVLIFSVSYYPFVGGAEIAWKEISDRISCVEFDMVTPRFDRSLPKTERIGNINVHRVGVGNIFDKIVFPITGAIKALSLNRQRQYSLSIGIMYNHASLAASFLKIIKKDIPFLLNLQDGDTDEMIARNTRGIKFLTDIIYRKPDCVTVLANFLKERALRHNAKGIITLIPNGVDIQKFEKEMSPEERLRLRHTLNLTEDDKIIITTSRLNYKNAIGNIIESLQFLDDSYKLIIIGNGDDERTLKGLSKRLGLSRRIFFLGYLEHDKMIPYLKISTVFCRPSLQEGLGNSFLEAMICGLPVVATRVGGIPDFLTDGVTGVFCEVKNPKSIAQKVTSLCENQSFKQKIITNAKAMVREKYDWNLIAENYTHIIETMTSPDKKSKS